MVLAYNLLRFIMTQMAYSYEEDRAVSDRAQTGDALPDMSTRAATYGISWKSPDDNEKDIGYGRKPRATHAVTATLSESGEKEAATISAAALFKILTDKH
ncbi:hypothetical protein AV650_21940 [Serratia fonticola]|nr:hypothetical protein AV650_21940 [Serratia fonticola]